MNLTRMGCVEVQLLLLAQDWSILRFGITIVGPLDSFSRELLLLSSYQLLVVMGYIPRR